MKYFFSKFYTTKKVLIRRGTSLLHEDRARVAFKMQLTALLVANCDVNVCLGIRTTNDFYFGRKP